MSKVLTEADQRDRAEAAAIVSYYPSVKGSEKIALEDDIVEALRSARNADPDRARLERLVIEAAKAEYAAIETYQGNSTMENWHMIAPAYDKRKAAVRALIDFESGQQWIKK